MQYLKFRRSSPTTLFGQSSRGLGHEEFCRAAIFFDLNWKAAVLMLMFCALSYPTIMWSTVRQSKDCGGEIIMSGADLLAPKMP